LEKYQPHAHVRHVILRALGSKPAAHGLHPTPTGSMQTRVLPHGSIGLRSEGLAPCPSAARLVPKVQVCPHWESMGVLSFLAQGLGPASSMGIQWDQGEASTPLRRATGHYIDPTHGPFLLHLVPAVVPRTLRSVHGHQWLEQKVAAAGTLCPAGCGRISPPSVPPSLRVPLDGVRNNQDLT
jgi:hypothetical protein